jgi:hypothetical protein
MRRRLSSEHEAAVPRGGAGARDRGSRPGSSRRAGRCGRARDQEQLLAQGSLAVTSGLSLPSTSSSRAERNSSSTSPRASRSSTPAAITASAKCSAGPASPCATARTASSARSPPRRPCSSRQAATSNVPSCPRATARTRSSAVSASRMLPRASRAISASTSGSSATLLVLADHREALLDVRLGHTTEQQHLAARPGSSRAPSGARSSPARTRRCPAAPRASSATR